MHLDSGVATELSGPRAHWALRQAASRLPEYHPFREDHEERNGALSEVQPSAVPNTVESLPRSSAEKPAYFCRLGGDVASANSETAAVSSGLSQTALRDTWCRKRVIGTLRPHLFHYQTPVTDNLLTL